MLKPKNTFTFLTKTLCKEAAYFYTLLSVGQNRFRKCSRERKFHAKGQLDHSLQLPHENKNKERIVKQLTLAVK